MLIAEISLELIGIYGPRNYSEWRDGGLPQVVMHRNFHLF